MTDILVTSPFHPFTLPSQFKAVFNGYIYCGTVDAVDPSVSQVQVYLVNESGDKVPVAQPLRTNAGGYLVYNGQPAKFVTDSNHSLLVHDSFHVQVWYAPDVSKVDPDAIASIIGAQSREALRRSYAEAGYNLVDGSFESGGVLSSAFDVLLHEASGKAYSGAGPFPQTVPPGTSTAGFIDRSQSLSHFVTAKTAEKAVELINSGAKNVLLITDGVDEIDQPLTIANVHGWHLHIAGTIHQPKHGYNGIVIEGCHGWRIAKSGLIQGHGSFPDKNINGGDGGGEKHYSLTVTGRFSQDTGGVDMGLGTFGGGYIGNVGSGVTIRKGCKNFYCGVSTTGFNGYGVIVGDLRTSLSDQLEVLSTDGLIDGELYSNYIAGVGVLACENVDVADEAYIHDNGHPDAVESDVTIDPGYGFTSVLVSNTGSHARNCTVGDCRLIGNKRKGFDVHSGDNVRCRSPYIAFSMIEGIAYSGTSGIRRGGGWDSPTIKNCGTATGGAADAKTGISVSGVFDGITPSGRAKLTNCGITYGIYWAANRSSFGGGFDLDNSLAAFTGGRPIYIQGASGAELTGATLDDLTANGTWTNPALVTYAKNCSLDKWNFTGATITSGTKQLEMTNCDISIGGQNRWKAPQFNTGNIGTMETAKSTVVVSYNGTSVVADIAKIASGARYISSITSGGSGIVVIGANNSDEPAISPPFEHTASVADVTLSSATFANVNYGKLRTPCETAGGRQQVSISPRDATTGAAIPINSASISELKLNVTINWTFQL